jgi:hypothetical protein
MGVCVKCDWFGEFFDSFDRGQIEELSCVVADRRAASSFLGGGRPCALFSVKPACAFDWSPGNRCDRALSALRRVGAALRCLFDGDAGVAGALFGVELAVVDGLESDDGGDANDFFDGCATGKVGGGFVEAEEELAVGVGFGEAVDEFEGDVAGVEVGEDEDVGAAGDGAAGGFEGADFGDDGGVGLEFAVDLGFEVVFDEVLFGEGGGGGDAFGVLGLGAATGGVAEHGDAGDAAGELTAELGGFDGDAGELFDVGVGDDAAVGEDEEAFVAVVAIGDLEDHAAGDAFDSGQGLDELEEGTQDAAGGGGGASDEAVGLAVLEHHGAEVIGVGDDLDGVGLGDAAVAVELFEAFDEEGKVFGFFGVDDVDAAQGGVDFFGGFFDFVAFAEEDGDAEFAFDVLDGSGNDVGLGAIGEDDTLGVAFEFIKDRLYKFHREGKVWVGLVAAHGRVNVEGPRIDASGEVDDVGESLRLEKLLGLGGADAVVTVQDDVVVALEFFGSAAGELAQGNELGARQTACLPFVRFAHVNQGYFFPCLQFIVQLLNCIGHKTTETIWENPALGKPCFSMPKATCKMLFIKALRKGNIKSREGCDHCWPLAFTGMPWPAGLVGGVAGLAIWVALERCSCKKVGMVVGRSWTTNLNTSGFPPRMTVTDVSLPTTLKKEASMTSAGQLIGRSPILTTVSPRANPLCEAGVSSKSCEISTP